VRFVTAASLFDGHDAAINIMRRILQGMGAEVIHLGHNRSVDEVVTAALQEDVQGIAISSYQGGHVEYFKYMVDLLKRGGEHIQVFGGGGGVIVPSEIPNCRPTAWPHLQPRRRPAHGAGRHDRRDGDAMRHRPVEAGAATTLAACKGHPTPHWRALAQLITALETARVDAAFKACTWRLGRHQGPGSGHHRHRRRRQVEPDRRADPPSAAGPG
jgi:methylmalonyl-CoA mutase